MLRLNRLKWGRFMLYLCWLCGLVSYWLYGLLSRGFRGLRTLLCVCPHRDVELSIRFLTWQNGMDSQNLLDNLVWGFGITVVVSTISGSMGALRTPWH